MNIDQIFTSRVPTPYNGLTPEEHAQLMAKFDVTIWLYVQVLRKMLVTDRKIRAWLKDIGPDLIKRYGLDRLIEMSRGLHEPESEKARRIAND